METAHVQQQLTVTDSSHQRGFAGPQALMQRLWLRDIERTRKGHRLGERHGPSPNLSHGLNDRDFDSA